MSKVTEVNKGFVELDLSKLEMAEWNYKTYDDKLQRKLVTNIKRNGFVENLIVRQVKDGKFEVVNGNHRFLAARELNFKKVMCYNLGKIKLPVAQRIALETNETKFKADKEKLASHLDMLMQEFDDFEETNPFDEKETQDLLKLVQEEEPEIGDEEEELEDDEIKSKKSKTAISGGGEQYQVVKLELTPSVSDKLTDTLDRFKFYGKGSQAPMEGLLNFIATFSDVELKQKLNIAPVKARKN